jgi:hypothetical protein
MNKIYSCQFCKTNFDQSNPVTCIYSLFGWFVLIMGGTKLPKKIKTNCMQCGELSVFSGKIDKDNLMNFFDELK